MRTPGESLAIGDYGRARTSIANTLSTKRSDRRFLLDRMRLAVLTLADGYPESAALIFEDVYDILRTQGINRDKTVASVVLNEDIKLWKGEPFEQALALAYYSMTQAELGSWDNARAAAENSLFYLRDFGRDSSGRRIDTAEIARRSARYEQALARGQDPDAALERGDYLDHGYVVRESNFTLGYLLHGIASQQLGLDEEASDYFLRVTELDPDLEPLTEAFRTGDYNTVLVVSFGLGPEKIGYGPDSALAKFRPRFRSTDSAIYVRVEDYEHRRYPQVHDVNYMAADHMWNNLEDIRIAKSQLGTGLLFGGIIATDVGARRGNDAALYGGLGALAAGAFMKAGAHVDIRYADLFPQRFYVVPLNITEPNTRVTLQVDGEPGSKLVLTGLNPPEGQDAQLRYVRLLSPRRGRTLPPAWATSGEIFYGNPVTGAVDESPLPWILGGRDVRLPTESTLDDYQRAGYLRGLTANQLRNLYAAEGILWSTEAQAGYARRHVLEGGRSLVAPLGGTTGFVRLFGQPRPPYKPQSQAVANLAEQVDDRAAGEPAEPDDEIEHVLSTSRH